MWLPRKTGHRPEVLHDAWISFQSGYSVTDDNALGSALAQKTAQAFTMAVDYDSFEMNFASVAQW
jgi:hypothetical protein